MPYDISQSDSGDCVVVKWLGNAKPSELVTSGEEAWSLAVEHGWSKILVDVRGIDNTLSTSNLFVATEEHSKLGPPRPRAAQLGRPDQVRDPKFIETAASNPDLLRLLIASPSIECWSRDLSTRHKASPHSIRG